MVKCREIGAVDMMCYLRSAELGRKAEALGEADPRRKWVGDWYLPPWEWEQETYTTKQYLEVMEKNGVDKSVIATAKLWEYTQNRPMSHFYYYEEEDVYQWVKTAPGKLYGLAGYNPFYIMESVAKVEKAVKEWDFKGVYVHSYGYDLCVDDRKFYPLYETCVALDVPVSMQIGQAATEVVPGEVGRPMAMDMIAIDFPRLTLIGSHTGWPWWDELIAMAMKHRNVYLDISAWPARWLQPSLVRWINGRCRDKTMWGSNGAITRAGEDFDTLDELIPKDEVKKLILRDNAMRVYKL